MLSVMQNINKKWELTHDKVGVKPRFTPNCWFCKMATGKSEPMVIRLVKMDIVGNTTAREVSDPIMKVEFKCPLCAWTTWFYVPVDIQYWGKVLALRRNIPLYYPSHEAWNDDDRIKLQLSLLGYWGGRKDLEELLEKMKKTEQDPVRIKNLTALLEKMKKEE